MAFDFSKFDGKKPSLLIPAGIHEVFIEKLVKKTAKDGGTYLSIWLRLPETKQVCFDIVSEFDEKQPLNLFKAYRLATILGFALSKKESLDSFTKKLSAHTGVVMLADITTKVNGEYTNNIISPNKEMYYPVGAQASAIVLDETVEDELTSAI
jgi:hypothetical protein